MVVYVAMSLIGRGIFTLAVLLMGFVMALWTFFLVLCQTFEAACEVWVSD